MEPPRANFSRSIGSPHDTASNVYAVLANHQSSDHSWALHQLLKWLQVWKDRFISEFKLEIKDISFCVDWLHWQRYGHFRPGHNGFGLLGEVAINRRYLFHREPWQLLGTLLHELLHAWQDVHGKPGKGNYHNRQFRTKAAVYGLIIDEAGRTEYESDSPFMLICPHQKSTHAPAQSSRSGRARVPPRSTFGSPSINFEHDASTAAAFSF
jgi:hypothetical protein